MKFADIQGHADVKDRLRRMADEDRVPHALLLEGTSGIGKLALARALAQYIHCTARTPDGDSCGRCPSCLQHNAMSHIDTFYTFPVVKKGSAGLCDDYLAQFRQMLSQSPYMDMTAWITHMGNPTAQPAIYVEEAAQLLNRLTRTARQSRYKVVVLWLPERLQEPAANKLLKLVEEPPGDTIFIMASDNPAAILPTIYSRTQRVRVAPYDDQQVADILADSFDVAWDTAASVAPLAAGSVARGRQLAEADGENSRFLALFMSLMRDAYTRKVKELRVWANDIAALGREGAMRFYDYCARLVRENFILNLNVPGLNAVSQAESEFSSRFSPYINTVNVEAIASVIDDARNDVALNANGKIVAFDLAVKMILLIKRGQE